MIITKAEARQLLVPGTEFRCVFTKRGDGTLRLMNAKVGEQPETVLNHGLILVTDTDKDDFRCVPLDGLDGLRIGQNGHWMTVRG